MKITLNREKPFFKTTNIKVIYLWQMTNELLMTSVWWCLHQNLLLWFPKSLFFLTIMLQFLQGVETMIYNWREERRSGYSLCRHCHLKDWMMNLSSCNVVVSWWPYIDVQMCINTASLYLTQVAQLDKNNGERGQCEEVIWYISLLKSLC